MGTLVRAPTWCFHPDFPATAWGRNSTLGGGICERRDLRRSGFSRLLPKAIRSVYPQQMDCIFLQAALFGISHGYQGVEAAVKIAIFGALYGLIALWRGSLRPGMIAHAGSDILSGIFGI